MRQHWTTQNQSIKHPFQQIVTQPSVVNVSVNGATISDGYWNKDGKVAMIPARDLTDALGIELEWNKETKTAELTRGALWTQVITGKDQYSVNKMPLHAGYSARNHRRQIVCTGFFC